MADFCGGKWWAWQGLNLRPLRCQHSAYGLKPQISATFDVPALRTSAEHAGNRVWFYRKFAARGSAPNIHGGFAA